MIFRLNDKKGVYCLEVDLKEANESKNALELFKADMVKFVSMATQVLSEDMIKKGLANIVYDVLFKEINAQELVKY